MKIDLYGELCSKLGKGVVWRMNPDDICDYIEKEYLSKAEEMITFDGKEDYIDVDKPVDKILKDKLMYISEAVLLKAIKTYLKHGYNSFGEHAVSCRLCQFMKELGLEEK